MKSQLFPFHVAIPVSNLEECREFYTLVLECKTGRSSDHWVDLDLFGHQFVLHQVDQATGDAGANPVDNMQIPVPHYGVVMDMETWSALRDRLMARNTEFIVEPYVRFEGQAGEQATMFLRDPSGNALEFKAFRNPEQLFSTQ